MVSERYFSAPRGRIVTVAIPLGEALVELVSRLQSSKEQYRIRVLFRPHETVLQLRTKFVRKGFEFVGHPAKMEPLIRFAGVTLHILGVSWEPRLSPGTVHFRRSMEIDNLPLPIATEVFSGAMFLSFSELDAQTISDAIMAVIPIGRLELLLRIYGSATELADPPEDKSAIERENTIIA